MKRCTGVGRANDRRPGQRDGVAIEAVDQNGPRRSIARRHEHVAARLSPGAERRLFMERPLETSRRWIRGEQWKIETYAVDELGAHPELDGESAHVTFGRGRPFELSANDTRDDHLAALVPKTIEPLAPCHERGRIRR